MQTKSSYYIAFLLLFSLMLKAQTVVPIGTGTGSSTSYPIYSIYNYSATECIYLGSEMNNNTGMITKLAYEKASGSSTTAPAVKIYMKTTTQTGVNNGSSSPYAIGTGFNDYTLVYDGTLPNGTATGWMEVTLGTPFVYSSTSQNLSILVVSSTYISSGRPSYKITSTGTPYKRSSYMSDTAPWSSSASMSSTGSDRPNIRLTFEAAIPCVSPPTPGNTVSSVASVCPANSFALSLQTTPTGTGISYQWQSSVNNTAWANISSATSSALTTTQTASTYYRCAVTCAGTTAYSNPVQVTMSNIIPFTESFETGQTSAANIAGCWSQQSITGSATWVANNSNTTYNRTPRTGSWNATLTYSNEDWLFYPLLLTGGVTYELQFYARQDATSGATIMAAYGTSGNSTAMTNTIVASTAVTSGDYQKYRGNFTPTTNGIYYIGIKATLNGTPWYVSLDDIKVDVAANCTGVTSVTTGNITAASASVSWTAPSTAPAGGYEYYLSTNATEPATTAVATGVVTTGTAVALSSLYANTTYYVWVRSVCAANDKSGWSNVASFTTACGVAALPLTQSFDAVTAPAMPSCYTVENANNDSTTWKTYQYSYASSPNSVYVNSASGNNNDNLYTPGVALLAGETYRISFKYYIPYSFNYKTDFQLKYGTSATATGMQQTLFTLTDAVGVLSNYDFINYTTDFVPATTGTYYIGFMTQDQGGIYLDDIALVHIPKCSTVTFPASVVATASKSSICTSEVLTFNLNSTMPTATGITYQWKSSTDGTTYTNAGTASASPQASILANLNAQYFKCEVLCNGSVVLTSAPVYVGINVSLNGVTSGTRCGFGTVELSAATQQGNTVNWYDNATNGTLLGTGTTFTSPEIAHTTTYYAAASGVQSNYSAGPATPQSVSTSYGNYNNGYAVIFTLAQTITLKSVNIYPSDQRDDNTVYLKDSAGNILKEYTFSTAGASLSTTSGIGNTFTVNLNWQIPAGTGYRLEWKYVSYNGANMLIYNNSNAAAQYNVNNNGLTFTGNTGNSSNYWYYFYDWKFTTGCGESDVRVPVTATVNYEWTGGTDDNWNNPANWCGGAVPGIQDDITVTNIGNTPAIKNNSTAYAKSLTLTGNADVTVTTGSTLWVENTVTIAESAKLTVQDNGALVQVQNTVNSGQIILNKKSSPLYRLDYILWASPVLGQNLQSFSPATSANRFYRYNSDSDVYSGVTAQSNNFVPGESYLVRMPNADSAPGYNSGDESLAFEGTFTGTPNNGTVTHSLATGGNRYTALGNPYPSPLNLASFFYENRNVMDASSGIYLWRKRNNGNSSSYATVSLGGFVANPVAGGGADIAENFLGESTNWTLAPGQGFLVRTLPGQQNPEATFTNSMRQAATTTQPFFRPARSTTSRLWLNLQAVNGAVSQTMVGYFSNATTGIDYGYDAQKFTDGTTISFYSLAENTTLAIQARPEFTTSDVVNLGYASPVAGSFTISLDHAEGIFGESQNIYLKDNLTGTLTNLNQTAYTFVTEAGTFNNRFEVVYNEQALGTDTPIADANTIVVYKQDTQIVVNSGNVLMDRVTVYDTNGRKLYSQSGIDNTQAIITGLTATQQVLIVTVQTARGSVSKKIIL